MTVPPMCCSRKGPHRAGGVPDPLAVCCADRARPHGLPALIFDMAGLQCLQFSACIAFGEVASLISAIGQIQK